MDGVLVLRGQLIPGAAEALAALDARRVPYLLATNTSLVSRATLARELGRAGVSVAARPDRDRGVRGGGARTGGASATNPCT